MQQLKKENVDVANCAKLLMPRLPTLIQGTPLIQPPAGTPLFWTQPLETNISLYRDSMSLRPCRNISYKIDGNYTRQNGGNKTIIAD